MRRFTLYTLVALLTFGISSFIVFTFYIKNINKSESKERSLVITESSPPKTIQSSSNIQVAQYSPTYNQEKTGQKEPFCRNKEILPIWSLIIKDRYFLEQSGGLFEKPDCSDMFEVLKFDLNQDGVKEILLRGNSGDLCGAVGNCGFWIFEKKGRSYRKVLSSSDYFEVNDMGDQITRQKTKGYYDILLKGHWNSSDTIHTTYKFDGQKYVESKCMVDYYIRGTQPNPKWKFITCREHQSLEKY